MKNILVILILILATTPIFAADWVEISEKAYIDVSSIVKKDGHIYVWMKTLNNGDLKPINGKRVHYSITQRVFDCTDRKIKSETSIFYGLEGKEVLETYSYGTPWQDIAPDTNGEYWHQTICKARI